MPFDFTILRQYTQVVKNLDFRQSRNEDNPFAVIYFPENHMLEDYYDRLNVERRNLKYIVVPLSRLPVVYLESETVAKLRDLGLLSYNRITSSLFNKNILIDLSYYLRKTEIQYSPVNYRSTYGNRIREYLKDIILEMGSQYRVVLVYAIDLESTFDLNYLNRKSQLLMNELDVTPTLVDEMLLCTFSPDVNYRLLIKETDFNKARLTSIFRGLKPALVKKEIIEEEEEIK